MTPELWSALEAISKALAVVVAWLLVMLGWAVANDLSAQRDRRGRDLARIAELRRWLGEIERHAVEFHTSAFDEQTKRDLGRKIKLVGLECSHLERSGVIEADWRLLNNQLRRAITWTNFERAEHEARAKASQIVDLVEISIDNFQTYLMRSVEKKDDQSEALRTTLMRLLRKF